MKYIHELEMRDTVIHIAMLEMERTIARYSNIPASNCVLHDANTMTLRRLATKNEMIKLIVIEDCGSNQMVREIVGVNHASLEENRRASFYDAVFFTLAARHRRWEALVATLHSRVWNHLGSILSGQFKTIRGSIGTTLHRVLVPKRHKMKDEISRGAIMGQ